MRTQLNELFSICFSAYAVCDCINTEPTDTMIAEGLEVYQKNGCDCLIGIGGGSPLDAMKAIAVGTTSSALLASYMGKEISGVIPPMAAIPTTAGTGSEVTKFTIITNTKTDVKMLLKGEVLLPKLAIVDASLSESTPQSVTAATGLDALTHAIEAYTSKQAQPLTDALAISAAKRIFRYLPLAYQDGKNREAREEMAAAALEAGICINNSSVTIVHGMSRPIGALFHVPSHVDHLPISTHTPAWGVTLDVVSKRHKIITRADYPMQNHTISHKIFLFYSFPLRSAPEFQIICGSQPE